MKLFQTFFIFFLVVFVTSTVVAQNKILNKSNFNPEQLDHDYFKKNIEVYFSFEASSKELIRELTNIISIANVQGTTVYAYASEKEYAQFLSFNIKHTILPKPSEQIIPEMSDNLDRVMDWNVYPTYGAYDTLMTQFAANYPSICKLINAGTTIEGRNILLVKISDNVNVRENEPQFFYSSTMHGNEPVGYVLMLRLIDSLLTTYGTNPRITNLINNAEIWINPLANPDGTYHGGNGTVYGAIRYNSQGFDLNRNFPNPISGVNTYEQPETAIFRTLAENNNFVLSANFHSGYEVVIYPWDCWSNLPPTSVSHADEDWYKFISHQYADTCQEYGPPNYMSGFDDGIINGGAWEPVYGTRMDYINWFVNGREVTIEINNGFILPATQLPMYWEYNRRSFLNYLENIFYGVRGIVTDTSGNPLKAMVKVLDHDTLHSEIRTDSLYGNYYRMLAPGNYTFYFSADSNYFPQTINNVAVNNFQTTILNVELIPVPATNVVQANLRGFNSYLLGQNYPNPFNPATTIKYQVPEKSIVTIIVYDVLGNEIETLVNEEKPAGTYELTLYATSLPSGVYFYRIKAGSFVETKKMLLLK